MQTYCQRLVWLVLMVGAPLLACNGDDGRRPLPDWSSGFESTETGGTLDLGDEPPRRDVDPEAFTLAPPLGATYPVSFHRRHSDRGCAVDDAAAGADLDIECVAEFNELDLWVLGLQFEVIVPEGMCDFVDLEHYLYENFPTGPGPTEVSATIDADGLYTDEVNSFQGEPVCEFDYSQLDPALPNCCLGSYTQTITREGSGKVSVRTRSWGGEAHLGDCYGGAGFRFASVNLTEDGFPLGEIYHLARAGFRKTMTYEGLSSGFPKDNRPLANYYEETDHDGLPTALRAPFAAPAYTLRCLDDAEEVIARIRLRVREWNLEREFDKGPDDGDPDSEGTEDDWMTPINDLLDWGDFAGNPDDHPRILRPGI